MADSTLKVESVLPNLELVLQKLSKLESKIGGSHESGLAVGLAAINRVSHLCDPGSTLVSPRMWAEFQ